MNETYTIPTYKIVGLSKEDEVNRFLLACQRATNDLSKVKDNIENIDDLINLINDQEMIQEIKWAVNHNHNATFAFNHLCDKYIYNNEDTEFIKNVEQIRKMVLRHLI